MAQEPHLTASQGLQPFLIHSPYWMKASPHHVSNGRVFDRTSPCWSVQVEGSGASQWIQLHALAETRNPQVDCAALTANPQLEPHDTKTYSNNYQQNNN